VDRLTSASARRTGTLGTFAGVFTPSILTILGIILFLRTGYVVGNAGLVGSLAIIGIATAVSILTSLSLSAIATNFEVRGGGDYYLISRTLGMEFGGALGVVLFLAQAVSIGFYAIGFAEALSTTLGWESAIGQQVLAVIAVAALFGLAWMGADWASRFQFGVMAILVLALGSFYIGAFDRFDSGTLTDGLGSLTGGDNFWVVFAIFFPAITGFTQGVSMSGDLRNPGRSLPRGTFAAVGLSTLVYLSVAVLFAGSAPQVDLAGDEGIMRTISASSFLIDAGVIAATLSSAMASFLGAPRILQSLASDRIFPLLNPFAEGHGEANNPRRGVLVALAIALGVVAIGNLNLVAPIVSMFFLISYGLLNYATYFEARAKSPSFRPRFRFYRPNVSLIGSLLCAAVIIAINPTAGGLAALLLFGIYQYLRSRPRPERWVASTSAHHFQRARESLSAMGPDQDTGRNWRPQVLVFSADPARRARLLRFASWIEGGSGFTCAVEIALGRGAAARRRQEQLRGALRRQIRSLDLEAFALVVEAEEVASAIPTIVQSVGLGAMRANTVLFNRPIEGSLDAESLRSVSRLGVNVAMLSAEDPGWDGLGKDRAIDVWWFDDDSSRLALLLAYLTTRTEEWASARIRVCASNADDDSLAMLQDYVEDIRIDAVCEAVPGGTVGTVVSASRSADLVLMPMRISKDEILDGHGQPLGDVFDRLPQTAAILAGQRVDLEAGPESGEASEVAALQEEVVDAEDRARTLNRVHEKLLVRLTDLRARAPRDVAARHELAELEEELATVRRRILKAEARAETARRELAERLDD
jgi:amino acid transporter